MAKPVKIPVETPIQCTTDEFYKFFQQKSNLLPLACGDIVQKIEFIDRNKSGNDTDMFCDFFPQKPSLLPLPYGNIVPKIEFLNGNKSAINTAGSLKRIYITPSPGKSENVKYKVAGVSNASKKITFNVLEGAMLAIYKYFNVTLEVTPENTAKWTVEYQKKSVANPEPDEYLNLLSTATAEVDAYILSNPSA